MNTTGSKGGFCYEYTGLTAGEVTQKQGSCQSSLKGTWNAGPCDVGSSSWCAQCVLPQSGTKCTTIKYDDAGYGCSSEGEDETKNNCTSQGGKWVQ